MAGRRLPPPIERRRDEALGAEGGGRGDQRGAKRWLRWCRVTEDSETGLRRCGKALFDLGRGLTRRRRLYSFRSRSERLPGTMHAEKRARVKCSLTRGSN